MKHSVPSCASHLGWLAPVLFALATTFAPAAVVGGYATHFLVSNQPGVADRTDPDLLNAWGLVVVPDGNLVVADNHSNLTTIYRPDGRRLSFTIETNEAPTGMVLNRSPREFRIGTRRHQGASLLLYATEAGTILGWSPEMKSTSTMVAVDNSASGAIYKGLALGGTTHRMLYAADFFNGKIDVFDSSFHSLGSFTDTTVDAGFAPFNVQNIGGKLWVTFALQKGPDNEDDQSGPGNGFVDVFDLQGHLLSRFASHGVLNSPWGLALAPRHFGKFSGALLVGNFGDGMINAFDPDTGVLLGPLADASGTPIQIEGLWALGFGRGYGWRPRGEPDDRDDDDHNDSSVKTNTLYFTAGPDDENDGLLGFIRPQ
jgi:uncharacterized protein (TIGR03118 family)